jgi:hypothetical protein
MFGPGRGGVAMISASHRPAFGLGQSASIPHAAADSTARCHASAGGTPSTRIRFSPLEPSTCQTVRLEGPVNAASPVLQPERRRRVIEASDDGV